MRKLYEKNDLTFALLFIGLYCLLQSLANPLGRLVGSRYAAGALLCLAQALFLRRFVHQNRLAEKYGLCRPAVPAKQVLYYIPLAVLSTSNLWNGIAVNLSWAETLWYILLMLCVGFLEELIFRGLLFQAMAKDSLPMATAVSSLTFGLGHLLNLVNGSGMSLADNLLQVTSAIAFGFLFSALALRCGSLLPCMLAHGAINITSAFANTAGSTMEKRIVSRVILMVIALAYALILIKRAPPLSEQEQRP